jgi:nickel/cobalt transporter (NiCoT) family protein
MPSLPSDWASLAIVVFLLGMKHGCDADHLATIDGLTRVGRRAGSRHAPYCGALFSLGHGAVVLAIAALVGSASEHWQTPAWLERSGVVISMFFLTLLGALNVRAVLTAAPCEVVAPVGLKGRCLGRLGRVERPWLVLLVGALFALSFDTVSQAALFAATAAEYGGIRAAVWLGALFLGGMLLIDGCNGLWVARLIARSDEHARSASRVMGLAVGSVSLMVAVLGAARIAAPPFARWSEGRELAFGALVAALVLLSFVGGRVLARRRAPVRLLTG